MLAPFWWQGCSLGFAKKLRFTVSGDNQWLEETMGWQRCTKTAAAHASMQEEGSGWTKRI